MEAVEQLLLNALAEKGYTYRDGKVVSVREPEKKEGENERFNLDNYTEKQYNDYGWARANDILDASENGELRSKFADAVKRKIVYPKTKSGEYMIEVGKTGNKIAFADGTIEKPIISSVIDIHLEGTDLEKVRSRIYASERQGIRQETGELFVRYDASDFRTKWKKISIEGVKPDNFGNGLQRGRGRSSAEGVKGKVYYSESENVRFSKGQNAKVAANNTGSRVYSKKLAKASIDVITESNLVFGDEYSTLKGTIKGKGAIIDELFYKLNRTQNKDYQRAVANDIAKQIIDRTVLEETYSIFAEQDAENIERAKRIVETMSGYRHRIMFDNIKGDVKYTKDNKWQGYALQWAAKDGDNIRRLTRRSFLFCLMDPSFGLAIVLLWC